LENEEECESFLADICTYQELESLAQRLQVALMLDEGKSYLEVNKETGVSTATIGRVSRSLQYGQGGYKTVLDRLKK
jgi:TrpR-related protein YerC/YecD